MAFSTEEIKANLTQLVVRWGIRRGYEKGEAQTFLNEFFACFGPEVADQARFEQHESGGGFIDCLLPGVAIIEMKSAKEAGRLKKHRKQALEYWRRSADKEAGKAAPPYVLICAFTRFELWEPGRFPDGPVLTIDLEDLPAHFAAFSFLLGKTPIYDANDEEVTVDAVKELALLLTSLEDRDEGSAGQRRSFLLQCVWCMFAEDTGQIDGLGFTRILDGLIDSPDRSSADDLGGLFERLNDPAKVRPQHGMYADVPYVNGSLFSSPTHLHLNSQELAVLRRMADFDWARIKPAIFGSLMQSVFGPDRQHQLGAHYTPEAEIQLVVEPTILRPWRRRIEGMETFEDAENALSDLHEFRVLDPACGCGNFLSIAYREIRRVERLLLDRRADLAKAEGRNLSGSPDSGHFPLSNMLGIEIESFAVDLARLSLWMAQWLAGHELGLHEKTLPLADLAGIRRDDALRTEWPEAEAIVSNPPYHGSQNLRGILTSDQIDYIESEFEVGLKDLCVYWFRKAADVMRPGDRAGMVGTNSISQNRNRAASLNYLVERGGVITDAVSMHPWPGEAVVNVSIVNWVQVLGAGQDTFLLDGKVVEGINTRLQESAVPIEEYRGLDANLGKAFQGPIPGGNFYLDSPEASQLMESDGEPSREVVRPFLIGRDITEDPEQSPTRHIVDFASMSLEQAMKFPACLELVTRRVKPEREKNNREAYRRYWWRFVEPRRGMRDAISGLPRYVAGTATGKRFLFAWAGHETCPSNATNVFAFDDDYSMGVLTSSVHGAWARSEGSTLRVDLRYTPTSCFETFPWPMPSKKQRVEIGEAVKSLLDLRSAICVDRQIGLTTLYNQVDDGAWQDLAAAHRKLDEAVAKAYGWPGKVAHDPLEIKARLAKLHAEIMEDPDSYRPF
ncbi:MAG TPA: DNA methyltransferase [Solirubrobacterales bacterium]|nr:DNA methyltransferase [Solirubrobacterales bacterium]